MNENTKKAVIAVLSLDPSVDLGTMNKIKGILKGLEPLPDTELYSLTEIANQTTFSRRALEGYVYRGDFPECVMIGRRKFYRYADVVEWLKGTRGSENEPRPEPDA